MAPDCVGSREMDGKAVLGLGPRDQVVGRWRSISEDRTWLRTRRQPLKTRLVPLFGRFITGKMDVVFVSGGDFSESNIDGSGDMLRLLGNG